MFEYLDLSQSHHSRHVDRLPAEVNEVNEKRLYGLVLILVMIVALVGAYAVYVSYRALEMTEQQERTRTTMAGLPPFANPDFDVLVTPPIVTVPESGGSVDVHLELKATKLTSSESLVLETHANIPRYSASFTPTSVLLHPGDSIGVELTVTIPRGVQNGTYPISIVARGKSTQGGGWLVIMVGSSQTGPPP